MYGRAAIRKSTGKLIEFQSGTEYRPGVPIPLGTLTRNAINAGIPADDVEEKYITEAEFAALMAATVTPEQKKQAEDEALIQKEVRDMAIASLKAKGKL